MYNWFNKQGRLVQCILLLIPFVNWLIEILVRGDKFIKKGGVINLLMLILAVVSFGILGWVDFFWCLLFNNLLFAA